MLFSNILLAAAALASSALAAGTLQFTTLPSAIVAGKPTTLTWSGGDGSPVIITLMEGPARNLKPVAVVEGPYSPIPTLQTNQLTNPRRRKRQLLRLDTLRLPPGRKRLRALNPAKQRPRPHQLHVRPPIPSHPHPIFPNQPTNPTIQKTQNHKTQN